MKKFVLVLGILVLASSVAMAQQAPPARGQGGAPGAGGGGRPAPVPAAPAPLLDMANKLAEAINKQDAATLTKMLAPDAVYLDEDGHSPAPAGWVTKLTSGAAPKKIEIAASHGQLWDTAGWFSFNYTLTETFQGAPKSVKGTASFVVKKPAGAADWQIALIHGALEQKVAGMTQ